MHSREELARRYGFETFADLLDASDRLSLIEGASGSYIARHRSGYWFVWEDGPRPPSAREANMPIDEMKVAKAVNECVDLCRLKKPMEVFGAIREFMKTLALTGNWTETELRAFEGAVNRALIFGPTDGVTYAGDATREPGRNPSGVSQARHLA